MSINYRGVCQFLKLYNLVHYLKTFSVTILQHFCVFQDMFRILCGYHVVTTWSNPRGKVHVATTWRPHGFLNIYHVVCTTWWPRGYHVVSTWYHVPHGIHVVSTWYPRGLHTGKSFSWRKKWRGRYVLFWWKQWRGKDFFLVESKTFFEVKK